MTLEELTKAIADLPDEERNELHKALGIELPSEDSILEKVLKALRGPEPPVIKDAEIRKAIETLEARVEAEQAQREALEKKLADREQADREREAQDKVAKLNDLGFTEEDAEHLANMPEAVYKKLVAFSEQKAVAELFKEVGKTSDGGDAEALIKAKAAEIRKAHPDMSEEDAEAEAWQQNPDLYRQYLAENRQSH